MADFLNGKHQYQFETLQLHVGQEQADPATDSRAYRFTPPHPMFFTIPPMRQLALVYQTPVIFTDV